jgi:hypothetical protein
MNGLVVTLVLFPLAGWSLERRNIGEVFLLGAGITGAFLFFAGVLHIPLVVALVLVAMWGLVSVVWELKHRSRNDLPPSTPHSLLPTVIMSVPLIALTFTTAVTPLNDFDGRAFWVLKARGIAHERSIDGPFFRGATLDPRNHYPLLVPLDGAAILGIAHDLDDRQLRWLYLGFLIALALLVRERIGRLVSPSAGAWCAALLVWIPQFAVEPEGGVLSAYSDIALAAFAAGAFFELMDAASEPRDQTVSGLAASFRFGLWLVFLVLTKSEGLPFALVLLVIGAFVFGNRIAVSAIMTGIATGALLVWRMRIPAGDEEDVIRLLPTLPDKLQHLGPSLAAFPTHMLLLSRWGIFWIAVIVAAILALRAGQRGAKLAVAMIVSMVAVYAAVYVATDWVVSDLITVTADRLLMHLIGPSLFLLALTARGTSRTFTGIRPSAAGPYKARMSPELQYRARADGDL